MPKISALPAAASVGATDLFAIVQGATTKKGTASLVLTYTQSNIQITESQVTNLTTDLAAKLAISQNLADLNNAATARTNLGLGTAAVLNTPIGMTVGGTGANLTAANGAIVYSTGTTLALLAPTATANQVVLSGSSAAPAFSTATYPATTTINQLLYSSAANTIAGLATTNRAALSTNATGVPTWLALTDGQLVIGSSAGAPAAASLIAGANITITPGSGTITIASSGNMTFSAVTGATQVITVNNGYIANRGGGVAFSLPAASAVGDVFSIVGLLGTWSITQGAGQQISVGAVATTVGAAGTLTAAAASDSAQFVCTVANLSWQVHGAPQTVGFVLA